MEEFQEEKQQEESIKKTAVQKEKEDTKDSIKNETNTAIEARLMQSIDVNSLMQYDTNMAEVFVKTFYSLSRDSIKSHGGNPGIVTSFLRNWTSTKGVGNLSKVLPTILTGMFTNLKISKTYHA